MPIFEQTSFVILSILQIIATLDIKPVPSTNISTADESDSVVKVSPFITKGGKDQESIQSSTAPDQGFHMGK